MRAFEMMVPPRQRSGARLVKAGKEAVYWQAHDGLQVHMARAEAPLPHLRMQPAMRGATPVADEASAPEGAQAFLVKSPRVTDAQGSRDVPVGAAGLLMALWMRLLADPAR